MGGSSRLADWVAMAKLVNGRVVVSNSLINRPSSTVALTTASYASESPSQAYAAMEVYSQFG